MGKLPTVQFGFDGVKSNGHLDNSVVIGKLSLVGEREEIRRDKSSTG